MPIKRDWMFIKDRQLQEYKNGVDQFLDAAFSCPGIVDRILCPCCRCSNGYYKGRSDVRSDLVNWGMEESFANWLYHEGMAYKSSSGDDSEEDLEKLVNDCVHEMVHGVTSYKDLVSTSTGAREESNAQSSENLNDGFDKALYPTGKISKLGFIKKILQIKKTHGMSDCSIDMLFELLKDAFPDKNLVPESVLEAEILMHDYNKKADSSKLRSQENLSGFSGQKNWKSGKASAGKHVQLVSNTCVTQSLVGGMKNTSLNDSENEKDKMQTLMLKKDVTGPSHTKQSQKKCNKKKGKGKGKNKDWT